jgi:LmbE family N-acetylglucosaminyl deacetylase
MAADVAWERYRCVLVVVAHPDDAEFHFGATIARLVDLGAEVSYVVCSDGGAGAGQTAAETATIRYAEQRAAAKLLGVTDVVFLGLPDGELAAGLELRRAIAEHIRRCRPDLVLTHYPRRVLEIPIQASHPDHVAVGEATLAAVYPDAGNPHAHPELLERGLAPHDVGEVWVPGYEHPNHFVDATALLDRKMAAILCHRSQLEGSDVETAPAWVGAWMRQAGIKPGYEYAEHFTRVQT